MTTQQPLFPMNSPSFNSSLEDFLARLFPLLEKDEDFLTTHEGHSFLISQGFSPHDSLGTWYWKMLKVYFTTTREGRLTLFSEFLPTLGMTFSGKFSIVGTSECHKIGNESILSDILEPRSEVDLKYFLSQKQVDGLRLFEGGSESRDKDEIKVRTIAHSGKFRRWNQVLDDRGITETLDTSGGGGHNPHVGVRAIQDQHGVALPVQLRKSENFMLGGSRMFEPGHPIPTLSSTEYKQPNGVALPVESGAIRNHGEWTLTDHALNIDANYWKGIDQHGARTAVIGVTDPDENGTSFYIRRLTPTECERLQSFPDGWTEGVSNTQRYKQMGNAVTVNVVETVMRRLFRSEDTSDNE